MIPDVPEPSWVARYRKLIVAVGGAVIQAAALWQDAHPGLIGGVAFLTAGIVAWVGNAPEPAEV